MVEFTLKNANDNDNSEDIEMNLSNLSVSVRCPICLSMQATNKSPQLLADGDLVDYFSISNYQRHIRSHIQKAKTAKKKSKAGNRSKSSSALLEEGQSSKKLKKTVNLGATLLSELNEQLITSSESDENDQIEKEMLANFESDNFVSELEVSSGSDENDVTDNLADNASCSIPIQRLPKLAKISSKPEENKDLGKINVLRSVFFFAFKNQLGPMLFLLFSFYQLQ